MMDKDKERSCDKIIRLETILETHLQKIVDGLDTLSALKIEAESNKEFRDVFVDRVRELVDAKLNTVQFEEQLKEVIKEEVEIIFNTDAVRSDFVTKVRDVMQSEMKKILLGVYVKITIVAGSIGTAVLTASAKGWFNG